MQTHIQECFERTATFRILFSNLVFAIDFFNAFEGLVQSKLRKGTTSKKKASSVRSGPIGEPVLDAVPGELVRVGGREDLVAYDF